MLLSRTKKTVDLADKENVKGRRSLGVKPKRQKIEDSSLMDDALIQACLDGVL
jgi:hypothetical protein